MLELPEVEVLRRFFQESAGHKDIANTVDYCDQGRIFKLSNQENTVTLADDHYSLSRIIT